jgi:gamma-glutamyltranspeptidase/glutathione hydrolase
MRDFHLPGRSPVLAMNGMCATSHPLAAKVAVETLETGGNAVDAAIAAAVVLGLAEPQMAGIGGDCFVLLKPPGEERIVALNGSGQAPAALTADGLRAKGLTAVPLGSADAVTIPGAVDAFCRLSADWGRLGLDRVLAPAIRYAEEGIPVAARVAFDWQRDAPRLTGDARRFYLLDDRPLTTGQIFRAPGQAEVLRRIAKNGRDGFYQGEVGDDMIASLNALGGVHAGADFGAMGSFYGDPISGMAQGHELVEHPPNGQGATAILLLNILAHFDLAALDPYGSDRAHLEAEATKLAYDARDQCIADPHHTTRLAYILAPETAERLAARIDTKRAAPVPPKPDQAVHRDTVYLTVVDRDRMAVSLIYSIFWGFGAGIASSKFGILFQNRGAGFTLEPGHPNEAGPGKRPMHTIIPAMLRKNNRLIMPFGVMGGDYQPAGHAALVTNHATYGMDIQTAIDAPRSFFDAGELQIERGFQASVSADLAARGHAVKLRDKPLGGAQAILIDRERGVLHGGSDPRKDGCALGY